MKYLFIPYELAVIAKEKGFNEPCFMFWDYQKEMQYKHPLNDYPVKN